MGGSGAGQGRAKVRYGQSPHLDFGGFDASIIFMLSGGILMPIMNFPEMLSQGILRPAAVRCDMVLHQAFRVRRTNKRHRR